LLPADTIVAEVGEGVQINVAFESACDHNGAVKRDRWIVTIDANGTGQCHSPVHKCHRPGLQQEKWNSRYPRPVLFKQQRSLMKTPDINTVIAEFDALPWEEKELAAGIIRKAFAEAAREAITTRVKTASRNLKAGKVRKGKLADLRKDLEA